MEVQLSRLERYFLSNQLRILEALYPDEAERFAVQREALEQGYELAYNIGMDHIHDETESLSNEESREVWETMDMFLSIDRTIEDFGLQEFHKGNFTRFAGYDGNNESKFMGFASFTVERLDRFTHLPLKEDGYFNSHMPTRPVYQRMLKVWRQIPYEKRFPMSKNDLLQVLEAATNPGHL
jgi:uncharacterized protein YfbU (UPF0304 family)